jgi:hypothetical protein
MALILIRPIFMVLAASARRPACSRGLIITDLSCGLKMSGIRDDDSEPNDDHGPLRQGKWKDNNLADRPQKHGTWDGLLREHK